MNPQLGFGTTVLVNTREYPDTTKWLYRLSLQQNNTLALFTYGNYASTATTTLTANTPIPIQWDIATAFNGFTVVSNTYITCAYAGSYLITASVELQKLAGSGSAGAAYCWLETTGNIQVPDSTRHIDVPTGETNAIPLNFIITLTAGQAFRLMIASDVSTISLLTIPASTSPYNQPRAPSANLTVHFVG